VGHFLLFDKDIRKTYNEFGLFCDFLSKYLFRKNNIENILIEKDVVRMEAGPGSSHNRRKKDNRIWTAKRSRL